MRNVGGVKLMDKKSTKDLTQIMDMTIDLIDQLAKHIVSVGMDM